jgi:hypothetical protein
MKRAYSENKFLYRPIATPVVWIAVVVSLDLEHVAQSIDLA